MNSLMSKLPFYYYKSKVASDITDTNQIELNLFENILNEALGQFFIMDATKTLSRYEKEFGIAIDESKNIDFRRNVIISKLRGTGTTTKDMIKNISLSYTNGDVDIIEDNNNACFTIKFINILGVPSNLEDLKLAINQIKPAHLECLYEFKYLTWDEFDKYNYSWDEFDKLHLTWDEFETHKKGVI